MIRRTLAPAAAALLLAVACSNTKIGDYEDPPPAVGFESGDGGAEASVDGAIRYCPVTTCASPWATCESSKFPCDVDLLNSDDNCGACGAKCAGENPSNWSKWTCVGGKCTFACTLGRYDCDGDVSNGCEAYLPEDVANCGACGHECEGDSWCYDGMCKPRCEVLALPDKCEGDCTDLQKDDYNCGRCGVVCDPEDPTRPRLHDSMYYGCVVGQCQPKCKDPSNYSNCNNKLDDGCEAPLSSTASCGSCGNACAEGKTCASENGAYRCLCNDNLTYCTGFMTSGCMSLDDDPFHCGGCNHVCPGMQTPHFEPKCNAGVCGGTCAVNYADCDGLYANGCEVDTQIDNRNCGGCGKACLPNQVCSGGTCLVAPCDPATPEGTTK